MHKETGCSECDGLWTEYEKATRQAFVIESKVQVAALSQESETVLLLQPELHGAVEKRRTLRKHILEHGIQAHGQADIGANDISK